MYVHHVLAVIQPQTEIFAGGFGGVIRLEDALLRFAQESGAFVHVLDGGGDDGMATEQAFYALAAIHRAETGKTTLYDMTDVMQ